MNKITSLINVVFKLLQHTWERAGILVIAVKAFQYIEDMTGALSLFQDAKKIFVKDENGKMIWERPWHVIASTFSITGAHAGSVANLLNTFGLVALGAGSAVCSVLTTSLFLAYFVWDSFTQLDTLWKNRKKIKEAEDQIEAANLLTRFISTTETVDLHAGAYPAIVPLQQNINSIPSKEKQITYLQQTKRHYEHLLIDHRSKRSKALLSLAANVGYIAIYALGIAMPMLSLAVTCAIVGIAIPAILFDIAVGVLDTRPPLGPAPPLPGIPSK